MTAFCRKVCVVFFLSMSVSLAVGAVYSWAGIGTVETDIDLRYRTETASVSVKLLQPSGTLLIIH